MRLFRWLGLALVLVTFGAGGVLDRPAHADDRRKASAKKSSGKKVAKGKGRSAKRSKNRRRRSYFKGHGVSAAELRQVPVDKPSGDVWLWNEHLREEVRVSIYRPDGSFDDQALAALDHGFRCRRTGEQRAVDPRLYETLSVIQDHFGGKRLDLVSGFRFQQGEGSRHYHASAADIRIDGVSERELYAFVQSLDTGGMGIGIYPVSGFVHVDFRAPGEPSYRWVDRSPPDGDSPKKRVSARYRPPS